MSRLVDWFGLKVYSDNVPQHRQGCYLITNLINGKQYVGSSVDIVVRFTESWLAKSHLAKDQSWLSQAFRKYGIGSFLLQPICYTWGDKKHLLTTEYILIDLYDTYNTGYNMTRATEPYEIFAEILSNSELEAKRIASLKAYYKTPEGQKSLRERTTFLWQDSGYRTNRAKAFARPEVQAKRSEAMRAAMARPEVRAKHEEAKAKPEYREGQREKSTVAWSNPELLKRHSDQAKKHLENPENYKQRVKQVLSVQEQATEAAVKVTKGSIWVTNGKDNQRVSKAMNIPSGWWAGRTIAKSGPTKGSVTFRWITNEVDSKNLAPGDPLPEGWRYGKAKWKSKEQVV